MSSKIITVSRQFGSGGHTIGKEVAEKLGIPCYDHELIEKVSAESGLAKDYIAEHGEYTSHSSRWANAFLSRSFDGKSIEDDLFIIQKQVILELAEKGSCVIVGRCADYILRDRDDCLRVFIHADMDKRAERIVKLYGETKDSPIKRLTDKDKRRRSYYQFYTDMEWGLAQNYHISLNSGALGIEKCVDIIVGLCR